MTNQPKGADTPDSFSIDECEEAFVRDFCPYSGSPDPLVVWRAAWASARRGGSTGTSEPVLFVRKGKVDDSDCDGVWKVLGAAPEGAGTSEPSAASMGGAAFEGRPHPSWKIARELAALNLGPTLKAQVDDIVSRILLSFVDAAPEGAGTSEPKGVDGLPMSARRLYGDEPIDDQWSPPAVAREPAKYDDVLVPFLALMRRELHANSGKGDRPGWLSMSRDKGLLEIYWHTAKLSVAVRDDNTDAIREHCADVANMAMMLLDVCGALIATSEGTYTQEQVDELNRVRQVETLAAKHRALAS